MSALDGIKAPLQAATPGPWETTQAADEETTTWIEAPSGDVLRHDERGHGHMRENFAWMKRADAELIAHAPTDLARLVAAVEAVLAECEDMEAQPASEIATVRGIGVIIRTVVNESLGGDA